MSHLIFPICGRLSRFLIFHPISVSYSLVEPQPLATLGLSLIITVLSRFSLHPISVCAIDLVCFRSFSHRRNNNGRRCRRCLGQAAAGILHSNNTSALPRLISVRSLHPELASNLPVSFVLAAQPPGTCAARTTRLKWPSLLPETVRGQGSSTKCVRGSEPSSFFCFHGGSVLGLTLLLTGPHLEQKRVQVGAAPERTNAVGH